MKAATLAIVVVCLFSSINSHLCTFNPIQRPPMNNVNQEATADCGLAPNFGYSGPCGGRNPQSPTEIIPAGRNYTVVFQKNENHWVAGSPGNFTISFAANAKNPQFQVLAVVPDTNTPALTVYSQNIDIEMVKEAVHGVIQIIYYTSPGQPGPFYQCSDVSVVLF